MAKNRATALMQFAPNDTTLHPSSEGSQQGFRDFRELRAAPRGGD